MRKELILHLYATDKLLKNTAAWGQWLPRAVLSHAESAPKWPCPVKGRAVIFGGNDEIFREIDFVFDRRKKGLTKTLEFV